MHLYISDQSETLETHLHHFQFAPVIKYDISRLKEKKNHVSVPCNKELKHLSFRFLFDYKIFPENILSAYTQWRHEGRTMQNGDTIVQQIYFPPTKTISQKIIAAVRIKEVLIEENVMGFSYETVQGHIEKGISSFLIEKTSGRLNFTIHTHSSSNNLILDLLSPVFSSPYQDYCTKKALHHMMKVFEKENN